MKDILHRFETHSPEDILNLQSDLYNDYDLTDVFNHFKEQGDEERAVAVLELILRSPDHSEMIDYPWLYQDLIEHFMFSGDHAAALRWAYAKLAYYAQHPEIGDWPTCHRDLADVYLYNRDVATGLAFYTRRLRTDPGDIWTYNALGLTLDDCGLGGLAVEALERGLTLRNHPDFEELEDQLHNLRQGLLDKMESGEISSDLEQVEPGVLADFQAALTIPVETQRSADEPEPHLPPVSRLVDADPDGEQDLYTEILAQGKILAPELIRLALDPDLQDTQAPTHAVALLRDLRSEMESEFTHLSGWLERADGDWYAKLLTRHMGKVGGFTTSELEDYAANRDAVEGIRLSALEALAEQAEKLPDLRQRVIDFMRHLLTRPEAQEANEEALIGILIGVALDLDARELYPEIKAAFDEDRVDPTVLSLVEVHEEWDLPTIPEPEGPKNSTYLLLQCTNCERVRGHFTRCVLLEMGTWDLQKEGERVRHSPYIMDHEIVCPKCGARDRYKMTPQGVFALLAPRDLESLGEILLGKEPSKPPRGDPRVYFLRSAAMGRSMHPFEALEAYLWHIAESPGDAHLHLALANILRLLFRYERALQEYRFAYELASSDPEVVIARALAEHDFGDQAIARKMYEKALAMQLAGAEDLTGAQDDSEFKQAVATGLSALQRGQPSPFESRAYNSEGEPAPLLPPSPFASSPKGAPKAGKKRRRRRM